MTLDLSKPIAAYYAAKNAQDIDAMLACFAMDAMVKDEGAAMRDHAAIRAWLEETTRKYGVSVAPDSIEQSGDLALVRALVSGNFPGSPTSLTYRFSLSANAISALEIG